MSMIKQSIQVLKLFLESKKIQPSEIPIFLQQVHTSLLMMSQKEHEAEAVQPPVVLQELPALLVKTAIPEPVADIPPVSAQTPVIVEDAKPSTPKAEPKTNPVAKGADKPTTKKPAVPISKSVTHDTLICLECGASQKAIKRHVFTSHGMDMPTYRQTYGLPEDYPTEAPIVSEKRAARFANR